MLRVRSLQWVVLVSGGREAADGPGAPCWACEVCGAEKGKFLATATHQSSGLDRQLHPARQLGLTVLSFSRSSLILWLLLDINFLELHTFETSWLAGSC